MCHYVLVSALPADPAATRPWTSPVTATVRLVTGSEPARRWAWLGALLRTLAGMVREAGLIVAGLGGIVTAAFLLHPVAGWAVLGAGLLVLDLCRRGPAKAGGP